MFGSEILDVVIGMIFVFLLLSLVCSAVSEIIEALVNKRAAYLERGIRELLNDKDGTGLAKDLYKHPLIAGLFRGKYNAENGDKPLFPSYIPARNFALALMDIVLPAEPAGKPDTDRAAAAAVKSGTDGATTPPEVPNSLEKLRSAVAANQNDDVRKALLALVDAAGNDAAKARENIENWFNSSMDRVSGWYKRRTQAIILGLGLLVAVGLNADSIIISNSLSYDKALRDSLAASAQEYAKNDASAASSVPSPASEETKNKCKNSKSQSAECKEVCLNDINSPRCKLETNLGKIQNLGLPIGWDRNNPKLVPPLSSWEDIGGWLLKIFGWLITAVAISLGAPFWFDLLNKFMVVRSTVKPREKSHEEGSKE